MNRCEDYQELISRMLDHDLSRAEREELAEHVKTCPDCAAVYVAFRSLSENLGGDLAEPPRALHESIMADVRRDALRRKNSAHRSHRGWHAVFTVAACLVLLVAAGLSLPNLVRMKGAAPAAPQAAEAILTEEAPAEEAIDEAVPAPDRANAKNAAGVASAQDTAEAPAEEPAEAPAPRPDAAEAENQSSLFDAERPLTLNEAQSEALIEHMTGEKLPVDNAPARELQLVYLRDGEPTPLTVLLYEDRAVYVFGDGDSYCLIDLSPAELLELLRGDG